MKKVLMIVSLLCFVVRGVAFAQDTAPKAEKPCACKQGDCKCKDGVDCGCKGKGDKAAGCGCKGKCDKAAGCGCKGKGKGDKAAGCGCKGDRAAGCGAKKDMAAKPVA